MDGTNQGENGADAGAGQADESATPGQQHGGALADKTVAAVFGEIVWLMSQSAEFKQFLVADLEWLVMPPVLLRQFRLFYQGDKPVAAVLYAKVSEEVEARLDAGAPSLRLADWQSGDRARVVKVIAPFGGGDEFAKEMAHFLLSGGTEQQQ